MGKAVYEWCPQPTTRTNRQPVRYSVKRAPVMRCPTCNKRVRLKTVNEETGHFEAAWRLPRHKRRVR